MTPNKLTITMSDTQMQKALDGDAEALGVLREKMRDALDQQKAELREEKYGEWWAEHPDKISFTGMWNGMKKETVIVKFPTPEVRDLCSASFELATALEDLLQQGQNDSTILAAEDALELAGWDI